MSDIQAERTDTNVPVNLIVNKNGGVASLTGSVKIRDGATTDYYLDFSDDTFKLMSWTAMSASLDDIGDGKYVLSGGLDIAAITNLSASTNHLVAEFAVTSSTEEGVACSLILLRDSVYDIPGDTWDETLATHLTSGSMGFIMGKMDVMSGSIETIRQISEGRWIISGTQMVFFDSDNTTEVMRFDLFDTEGDPFSSEADAPAERVRV